MNRSVLWKSRLLPFEEIGAAQKHVSCGASGNSRPLDRLNTRNDRSCGNFNTEMRCVLSSCARAGPELFCRVRADSGGFCCRPGIGRIMRPTICVHRGKVVAATCVKSAASSAAWSFHGRVVHGARNGAYGRVIFGSSVTESGKIPRPCQPPWKAANR